MFFLKGGRGESADHRPTTADRRRFKRTEVLSIYKEITKVVHIEKLRC